MRDTGLCEAMPTAEAPQVGLAKFKTYKREWLKADLVAGITVSALLVPEGMAYAELAGVPPQAAFYAAPIALLMFALLGTSRVLVVAVSSAVSATASSIVSAMGSGDAVEFAALAAALAVFAGVIMMLAGFFKLGKISEFFSESVLKGFVFGLEHRLPRLPAALITLVFGISTSMFFGLEDRGVEVIGIIPSGLAAPAVPDVDASQIGNLLAGGIGLGLPIFAEAIGPARQLAKKHGHQIDLDRELIAVVISLLMVLRRVSRPAVSRLGREPGHLSFVDLAQNSGANTVPGILIAQPNAELFFANISGVRAEILEIVRAADPPYRTVLLDRSGALETIGEQRIQLRELLDALYAEGD